MLVMLGTCGERHGVNDKFEAFGARHADLQEAPGVVGADEHVEIFKIFA
jgi:hypothetical protein